MIISASRRTDIPAFYSEWLLNRVREGFLYVRNPQYVTQVSRISLDRQVVDCFVFWTKNPIPMLKRLDGFDAYPYYFQYTLTGYGRDVEGNLPDKKERLIPAFLELSDRIGRERVIWRYDPILFNERYTEDYHLRAFRQIAEALEGRTEKCVISFVDVYAKNKKRLESLQTQSRTDEQLMDFAGRLKDIAEAHGMTIGTCAEAIDLSGVGIGHNACIDKSLIERITGCRIKVRKDPTQRSECMCAQSIDIGSNNTCGNNCIYCYANYSPEVVRRTMARYDLNSPILCDQLKPGDRITEREMKSLLDGQMSFLDNL